MLKRSKTWNQQFKLPIWETILNKQFIPNRNTNKLTTKEYWDCGYNPSYEAFVYAFVIFICFCYFLNVICLDFWQSHFVQNVLTQNILPSNLDLLTLLSLFPRYTQLGRERMWVASFTTAKRWKQPQHVKSLVGTREDK